MTTNTTEIIDSLEGYVLDIKPYHSKLSDIIVEYAFFDDVPVHISEQHVIRALLNSIWSKSIISGPTTVVSKYPLRAPYSAPSFFHFQNNFNGASYDQDILSSLGYKMFDKHFRHETKLVKKNGIHQLEGHDYFQTKGAYSFNILPENKVIQTSHTATVGWNDPDYSFSDGSTYPYNISNAVDASPKFASTYEMSIGTLTVQTNTQFTIATNFEVRFLSVTKGIERFALYYAGDNVPIVEFIANDFITCFSDTLIISYSPNPKIEFDFPVGSLVATFSMQPTAVQSGDMDIMMTVPLNFVGPFPNEYMVLERDVEQILTFAESSINVKFDNGVQQFRKWKFVRTDKLVDGTPTDKIVFNVFVADALDVYPVSPAAFQAYEGIPFSSSVLDPTDPNVVDFTITAFPSGVPIGTEYEIDTDALAAVMPFTLSFFDATTDVLVASFSSLLDANFQAHFMWGVYTFTVFAYDLIGSFSAVRTELEYSDFIPHKQIRTDSVLFRTKPADITTIFDVNVFNEITIKVRSANVNPTFSIYYQNELLGVIHDGQSFVSDEISFTLEATPLFTQLVNPLNKSYFDLIIRPINKLMIVPGAPLETWTFVKVNPVSYSRPAMNLANAGDLDVTNLWAGTPTQKWTVTCIDANGTYSVVGLVSGQADANFIVSTPSTVSVSGQDHFDLAYLVPTGSQPYTNIVGDFFTIDIENIVATIPFAELVYGYDLAPYDDPYYDSRFQVYNVNDINFQMTVDIPSAFLEIRALNATTFSVNLYDRTDYKNGIKTLISSYPNALLDTPYTFEFGTFTIISPYDPVDPPSFVVNDLFVIEIDNPPPVVLGVWLNSINMPFAHLYGNSFVDVDPKSWYFNAQADGTFSVSSLPVSSFASSNMTPGVAYDNSEVHLTFYPSSVIPITPGDSFTFDIYEVQPSYKVFGSLSGEQEMAVIGEWHNNGKIAFILDKPYASVMSGYGTPNSRRFDVVPSFNTQAVTLDDDLHLVQFDRPVRSDAVADNYLFRYSSSNNAFGVISKTGHKYGVDFSVDAEWTDRLQNPCLSQDLSFDVKHADGILAMTVLKTNPYDLQPIEYRDDYEINIDIYDHGFPLYHSHFGLLFTSSQDSDSLFVEDLTFDQIAMCINSTSTSMPQIDGVPATTHLEAFDNGLVLPLNSTDNYPDDRRTAWGTEAMLLFGNKQYEIAMIANRIQNVADIGTVNVDLYSAVNPTLKIGSVRQKDSGLRPTIQFEPDFVNTYFGTQGAKFNVKVEQGQMMNTVASTKITETFKFAERMNFKDDVVTITMTESVEFVPNWAGLRFEDDFVVIVGDAEYGPMHKYGGYDTLAYDSEIDDIDAQLGGPLDLDNDGILDSTEPGNVFNDPNSGYDLNVKFAESGLAVWSTEFITEPPSQTIAPQIIEVFAIYNTNMTTLAITALIQMTQQIDITVDSPLYGTYTFASYSQEVGKNVFFNGSFQDLIITELTVNHPFGTLITALNISSKVIVVNNLNDLTPIPVTLTWINNNSFKVVPTVPGTFAVIVV